MLRNVIGGLVFVAVTGLPTPSPPTAQIPADTAVAHAVYWGEPLADLLRSIGALVQEGFGAPEIERISREALQLSPYPSTTSPPRHVVVFAHRVRFQNRLTRLDIRVTAIEFGHVDVRFQTADTALIAAVHDLIWKAHLASLLPIERVRLTAHEQILAGRPPTLVLTLETVRQYSCLGFGIDHAFTQRADTLRLTFFGVSAPMGLCPTAFGPASTSRELHIPPGRYALVIDYRAASDSMALEVTDSSTKPTSERATFVEADERLRWRYPQRTFALFCGSIEVARSVCEDVRRWLLGRAGIAQLYLSPEGLNPYRPEPGKNSDEQAAFFRYANQKALGPVRRCFAEIEGQIRQAVGVFLTLRTWTGEQITAWSGRSYDQAHIAVPRRVTAGPTCTGAP